MFTAESAGKRIVKIGQYLAKLWANLWCPVFLLMGYSITVLHFKHKDDGLAVYAA